MEEYIKDAINASGNEVLLEAYDKEWALKDEGKREGYQDGYDEGYDKGIEQGIEETMSDVVCNMLAKFLDINLISEITGLSIDRINDIKNENFDSKSK